MKKTHNFWDKIYEYTKTGKYRNSCDFCLLSSNQNEKKKQQGIEDKYETKDENIWFNSI